MKKILFITPKIPIPATSGGLIGSLASLRFLAKYYDVDIISFFDKKNDNKDFLIQELKNIGVKNTFFIDYIVKKRSLLTIFKALFGSSPLTVFRNKSKQMRDFVENISQNYDVIFADHWLSAQYLPKNFKGKSILKEHNAEYVMWERFYHLEKNIIKKLYLYFEIKKIKRYESKICNIFDHVITVTEDDKKSLVQIGANSNKIEMLPSLIMQSNQVVPDFSTRENSLMYVGTLTWDANIDGLKYFLNNIYPSLKTRIKDLKFYIIGKNPPNDIIQFSKNDNSIIITGFVENLEEYYNKSKLLVVYLRYGSGIKIKILESLSHGLPVIANEVGVEGIKTDGVQLAISDDDFIQDIEILMADSNKLNDMSAQGRLYIDRNYSESSYVEYYKKIMQEFANE